MDSEKEMKGWQVARTKTEEQPSSRGRDEREYRLDKKSRLEAKR